MKKMTLLQALKKMRQMVVKGKVVKNPNNLYEDGEGNYVPDIENAKCGCLMGIAYIAAGDERLASFIIGLDPFTWERDKTCTQITRKGPAAMLEIIDAQIKKAQENEVATH